MRKTIPLALALAVSLAAGAASAAEVALTDANVQQVRTLLEAEGYQVARVKIEDGRYEAHARKDGQRYEVYLDSAFKIVRAERDD